MYELKEREFTLGKWLGAATYYFKKNIKVILLFVLLFGFALPLLFDISPRSTYLEPIVGQRQGVILTFVWAIVNTFYQIAIIVTLEESVNGNQVCFTKAFSRSGSLLLEGYLTNLLGGLIIFGLSLLLIVPGVIWGVYYTFILQVVALRKIRYKKALDYSKDLVKGRWWKVLGYTVLLHIVPVIIGLIIIESPIFLSSTLLYLFASFIIAVIGGYATVATTMLFLNLDYTTNGAVDRAID